MQPEVSQWALTLAHALQWLVPGFLLGLLAVPSAINSRRPAVSTIAWILTLISLPYLGFILYFAIGHTRTTRRVRRRRQARTLVASGLVGMRGGTVRFRATDDWTLPTLNPLGQGLARMARSMNGAPLTVGNRAHILVDGEAKFPSLLETIEAAKDHIHLEYYIFQPDATGHHILEALTRKAQAGVEVRVLVDAVGSLSIASDFFDALEAAGGRTARFVTGRFSGRRLDINFRNHRKIAVIDGRVGFTGGLNIGDEYSGMGTVDAWHDIHMRIEGPAVHYLQETFTEDWFFATREDLAVRRYFPDPLMVGDDTLQIVASGPDLEWPTLHQIFFGAITQAREHVFIVTPYFVPTEPLLTALVAAAHRGVDVRIILPRTVDHLLVYLAARSYYEELLNAGVRIFEYTPRMLHAKVMTVDGLFGTIGTCNMDVRSFYLNFEINAIFYSTLLARRLEATIHHDLEQSSEIILSHFVRRPYHKRLAENTCRLLSPLL